MFHSKEMAMRDPIAQEASVIEGEPVRGSIPPSWFWALPGIERVRAFSQGLLLTPPLARLQGMRAAHVGPGSGTWTMLASTWLQGPTRVVEISAFVETALTGVTLTAAPPGIAVIPRTLAVNYFRPCRPQAGNLLARGRVLNTSRFFAFTELEIEDPEGRHIAHAAAPPRRLGCCPSMSRSTRRPICPCARLHRRWRRLRTGPGTAVWPLCVSTRTACA
jgi:acyl-coenzyme A thioesterase PaaI-like protein